MNGRSVLAHPELVTILFSVLVNRLGGTVVIAQADIDDVAFNRLNEEALEDGSIKFSFERRSKAS